jgi:putative holliday junction resolvase
MTVAGVDLGARRLGLAVTDPEERSAYPLRTIARTNITSDLKAITAELAPRDIRLIVVGLPLNMDGSEGSQARAARIFARRLADFTGIKVELYDERLTSFEAKERLKLLFASSKKRKAVLDAIAASVILESWLSAKR